MASLSVLTMCEFMQNCMKINVGFESRFEVAKKIQSRYCSLKSFVDKSHPAIFLGNQSFGYIGDKITERTSKV